MSRSKNTILKSVFVLSLISATVALASTKVNNQNSRSAIEMVETKTAPVTHVTGVVTDGVRKNIQRLDVEGKVAKLQHKIKPIGQKITSTVGPKFTPAVRTVKQGERRMSLPALLLIFVFGGVLFFLGISGPISRLGGRH